MSRIFSIRDEHGIRTYNNGIKISIDAEGHASIQGRCSETETLETLLTDFENRLGSLRANTNTRPNETIREYQALLEIKNRIQHFRMTTLPGTLRERIETSINGTAWRELHQHLDVSRPDTFHVALPPDNLARTLRQTPNNLGFQSPAVRFQAHSILFRSLGECRRSLQNAHNAENREERDRYLLEAIRFYRRAFYCEENLVRDRHPLQILPVHTMFGGQIAALREEFIHFPNLPP